MYILPQVFGYYNLNTILLIGFHIFLVAGRFIPHRNAPCEQNGRMNGYYAFFPLRAAFAKIIVQGYVPGAVFGVVEAVVAIQTELGHAGILLGGYGQYIDIAKIRI